jgi:hypothetical protein
MTRKKSIFMKTLRFGQCAVLAGILLSLASPLSADILFSLLPSNGNVSGPPGSLVGWGYSLSNTDPSNWFVSTNLNSDSFSNGAPTSLFDFPILSPGGTETESFDSVNSIGLFELQWDVGTPTGFVNSGNFVLSGEWWDGDPFNGGNFISNATDISLAYSATVTGPVSSVPEPRHIEFLILVLTAIVTWATKVVSWCAR